MRVPQDSDDALSALLDDAHAGFARRVRAIGPGRWEDPTPCPDWTVTDLVNHAVQGNLVYTALLGGGKAEDFLTSLDENALGDAPSESFERAAASCAAALREPGALERAVDYPFGPAVGRKLLGLMVTDMTVHAWDLARAVGGDDQLPPRLVTWISAHVEWLYDGMDESPLSPANSFRYYAAPLPPSSSPDGPQERLLRLMGRDPEWVADG
ncbi:TIGR03086 family metal-binding protein [Streptomyces sp. NPDC048172]|uniref:TIGR03086 family metal-binding protein n=1 Tax=Streptomyces sp. NPDC048172 TaxID=3365505 RepID=UPI003712F7BA